MKKIIFAWVTLLNAMWMVHGQEIMTPARFREIVAMPGDSVPLGPKLAAIPLWTNAEATVVMKYANGKVVREEMAPTAKMAGGKYVVFSVESPSYHQTMNSILTYDEKASALKIYGLFGDGHGGGIVTEGTIVYDYDRKIYAVSSEYGDGFKEITIGSYSDRESADKTEIFKNGVLVMTREVKTRKK